MTNIHEQLMDEAYDRWQNGDLKGKSYQEFLTNLAPKHRYAVQLGNYNYQVLNGGHQQWLINRYAEHLPYTLFTMVLTQMIQGGYGLAKQVMRFAQDAYQVERIFAEGREIPEDIDYLETLDNRYYDIDEDFMVQCEFFLREVCNIKITEDDLIANDRALNAK